MTRFCGRDLEALEELVLVADELAQPEIALVIAVGEGLGALHLHHPRRGLHQAVVRERGGIGKPAAELVEGVHDRPARGRRTAAADAGARREQIVEADDGCVGHGASILTTACHVNVTGAELTRPEGGYIVASWQSQPRSRSCAGAGTHPARSSRSCGTTSSAACARRAALLRHHRLRGKRRPADRERRAERPGHRLPRRARPGQDAHGPPPRQSPRRGDAGHGRMRDQRRPPRPHLPGVHAQAGRARATPRRSPGSPAIAATARSSPPPTSPSPT